MSPQQLIQEHVRDYQGVLSIILRILSYTACLFVSMQISVTYMGDTYLANLGMFTIFSTCLELLWSAATIRPVLVRLSYIFCVVGIGLVATYLLWNVHHLRGCEPRPTHTVSAQVPR